MFSCSPHRLHFISMKLTTSLRTSFRKPPRVGIFFGFRFLARPHRGHPAGRPPGSGDWLRTSRVGELLVRHPPFRPAMLEVFIGLGIAVKREGKFYFYNMLTLLRPLFLKMMKEYSVVRTLSLSMSMMLIMWRGMIGELMKTLLASTLSTFMERSGKSGNGGNGRRVDKDFAKINSLNIRGGKWEACWRISTNNFLNIAGIMSSFVFIFSRLYSVRR